MYVIIFLIFCEFSTNFLNDILGANLVAAITTDNLQRKFFNPSLQVLFYPMTNLWEYNNTESFKKYKNGYVLNAASTVAFLNSYLRTPEDGKDIRYFTSVFDILIFNSMFN